MKRTFHQYKSYWIAYRKDWIGTSISPIGLPSILLEEYSVRRLGGLQESHCDLKLRMRFLQADHADALWLQKLLPSPKLPSPPLPFLPLLFLLLYQVSHFILPDSPINCIKRCILLELKEKNHLEWSWKKVGRVIRIEIFGHYFFPIIILL